MTNHLSLQLQMQGIPRGKLSFISLTERDFLVPSINLLIPIPKRDSVLRLFLAIKKVTGPISIEEQELKHTNNHGRFLCSHHN